MSEAHSTIAAAKPRHQSVAMGADGAWASIGAHALRAAIQSQSPRAVTDLLNTMDAHDMAKTLQEVGIAVDAQWVMQGRGVVYKNVKDVLQQALSVGHVDVTTSTPRAQAQPSAQKRSALEIIQQVLKAPQVTVGTLGEMPMHQRASLHMVAGQALQKGILGFGFDGIEGRFKVPGSIEDIVKLHRDAAAEVAIQSTKIGLQRWSQGIPVNGLSEWIPDSVQRLLAGSLSIEAAQVMISGLSTGTIARHAEEYGSGGISSLLLAKGLDPDAPTVFQQAEELGLTIKAVDKERGQYFGTVIAQDHRASLVKVNTREVIELPFSDVRGQKPRMGEALRIGFKSGALSVTSIQAAQAEIGR